jgi:hypothetical protein
MVKDYELVAALDNVAKEIHEYDPNPITWLHWIVYLMKKLESESLDIDSAHRDLYKDMLSNLKDAIHTQQQTGSW